MNAGEFIRSNVHHGADHGRKKLADARKLQAWVKADCRAVWKLKPSRLDKISLGQRTLCGNGRPPERSRPSDPIDGLVGGLWVGPHTCGFRYCSLVIPS